MPTCVQEHVGTVPTTTEPDDASAMVTEHGVVAVGRGLLLGLGVGVLSAKFVQLGTATSSVFDGGDEGVATVYLSLQSSDAVGDGLDANVLVLGFE